MISKIIFTTKDGYDITEGMKYYSVKVKEYETHLAIKKLKSFKKTTIMEYVWAIYQSWST